MRLPLTLLSRSLSASATRRQTYSGISEFWAQDAGPQYGMGPVMDRTKEKLGTGEVVAFSVGPKRVQEALRSALAMGVDRAVHVNTEGKPLGWMSVDDWEAMNATLEKYGEMKGRKPATAYFTNDFLP